MKSCIYEGTIRHRRFVPVRNDFCYRLFLMYLDFSEIKQVFSFHPLWSYDRPNLAWFRRQDHFGNPQIPLDQAVRDLVQDRTGKRPDGPIRALCHLRYFGHCFNPASFYYCWDAPDKRVETIVVEIQNTPWGESHCYVMGSKDNVHPLWDWRRHQFAKAFHVSPFIDMDIRYDWRFRQPRDVLNVHMIDYHNGRKIFDASLDVKRREITRRSLGRVLVQYPLMTAKVVGMIYWQAARLKFKGAPFYPHPRKRPAGGGKAIAMTEHIIPANAPARETLNVRSLDRFSRGILFKLLSRLERGRLHLVDGAERHTFGQTSDRFPLEATLTVHHHRFYGDCLFGGTIGAGEAYMSGFWSTNDLTDVIRIFALHPELFSGMDKGFARIMTPLYKYFHASKKNTREGSRRNIVAHYDLGNDFYQLFLDDTMTYSCGIFERADSSLREAAIAKYDRICRKLELSSADHVLEIGTGWGGFAIHAATHYGCRVTTTTISDRQYEMARQRFAAAGVSDRITVLKQDYRDLTGTFDKLVSIEMIEAVGHHFLDEFFRVCSERLKPEGMMLLQAITIRDQVFDWHKRNVDFIKRYIFPGSCIPSITAISEAVAEATDLRMFHLEDITAHYAKTLRKWRENFFANLDNVKALGFSDAFVRMWEFYLCYCEGGFSERYLGDVQILFMKPMCRKDPILPPLPAVAARSHSR